MSVKYQLSCLQEEEDDVPQDMLSGASSVSSLGKQELLYIRCVQVGMLVFDSSGVISLSGIK